MDSIQQLHTDALKFDGVAPFNEATLLALRNGDEARIDIRFEAPGDVVVAAALAFDEAAVELTVDPRFRRGGLGRKLLDSAVAEGERTFWAHGDLPAAQALAERAGLQAQRTLLVLRNEFTKAPAAEVLPDGVTIRTFESRDIDAIVAVNARSFASHPEQGAMDRADFERRAASDWFDPAGLFVAERDGRVIGFHWTKVEDGLGEVYVVGVDPDAQGGGLGKALTARGLRHLHESGIRTVDLYVEADNAPALKVYTNLGFAPHAKDTLYSHPSPAPSP